MASTASHAPLRRVLAGISLMVVSSMILGGAAAAAIANVEGKVNQATGPSWIPAVVARSAGASGTTYSIRVRAMVDDAFVDEFGADWAGEAVRVLNLAAPLLAQVEIGLDIVEVDEWYPTTDASLADMLADLSSTTPAPGDVVVIALTTRQTSEEPRHDGWTTGRAPAAIIKVGDPAGPELGALITHEIGHILGVGHHEDECAEGGCLMDSVGFSHGYRWCEHHIENVAAILDHI